jgi:hypothetical protein
LFKAGRKSVPGSPLLVGSGATPETIRPLLEIADGAIVGTAIKTEGKLAQAIDPARVALLVRGSR